MHHLSRTLAILAFVVAGVIGVGAFVALAQSTSPVQRTVGGPRSTATVAPAATAPPLPLGDQSLVRGELRSTNTGGSGDDLKALARLIQGGKTSMSRLIPYRGPRPPIPKLTDLLKHRARFKQSASGGTIVLTGTSSVPYLDDQTLSYGADVYWLCQNLKATTNYRYIVFPPDGTAYRVTPRDYVAGGQVADTFPTDAQGRCMQTPGGGARAGQQVPYYAQLTLSTPLVSSGSPDGIVAVGPTRGAGADAPYSGVWAIAVQNSATGAYEAVAYSVVLGTLNFATYSNAGFTTQANDFASGATVYVSAGGLNPAHFYSFGFVNTSGNGLPCVFSIPAGAQNFGNGTCFVSGATGILPTAQSLSGQYATPAAGANSLGTQTVQLFDATTNDLISTQQISLNPSAVTWSSLVPYNATLGNGANLGDTFATDGLLGTPGGAASPEQSVTGLNYQVSGLTAGHVYRITVSNANGVVLSSTTTDGNPTFGSPQAFALPYSFTAPGVSSGVQQVPFPINATNFTSFSATQIPFAPSVYTAQLYDTNTSTVVGSKSFTLVSYGSTFQWTNPAGSYVNGNPSGNPTAVTATVRNTAGTLYGNWNGDAIKAITIRNDTAGNVTLALQTGVTTTIDSIGQTWNLTLVSGAQINATPVVAGQSLPPNATIPIPVSILVPPNVCTTACLLQTQITPLHGIAPSAYNATMTNTASNGLAVYSNNVVGTNNEASYSITVGTYAGAGSLLGTPRYNRAMYRSGTHGAPSNGAVYPPTSYYPLTISVTNNGPGPIYSIEFVMPPTVDPNVLMPSITSATVNATNQTANWQLVTQNGNAGNGILGDGTLGPNAFALTANAKTTTPGIATGKTATFVLRMPILLSAFPFQEIPATANYGNPKGFGGGGGALFQMAPTNVLTNAVAGTQNIDSTELSVFSLDTSLMSASITPAVVPALANQNWTFKFLNTSTGLDPNPDYISQLLVTVPAAGAGIFPTVTSVTGSNGATWNANATGTQGQWLIDLCAVGTAPNVAAQTSTPCAGTTDSSSLPPGGSLTINFNYASAATVGTYNVNWTVVGANGGAVVPATGSQIPVLTVANTTAQTSFTFAGGYTATPSHPPVAPIQAVIFGSQPVVGSWADFNNGNGFVFELHNNGSTNITNVSLAIPWANTSGQLFDTANPWKLVPTSIFVYGAGAGAGGSKCLGNSYLSLVQAVNGAPGTSGLLQLSGCNVAVGQNLDISFYATSPYDIGSTFRFDSAVATANGTPPDPRVGGNPNTLPIYSLSNTLRVITDARLVIEVPTGAAWPGGTFFGQGTAAALTCGGCTFTNSATPIIDLSTIAGTATILDTLGATVYSDDTNGWNLSVSADVNPTTSSGQVTTFMQTGHSGTPGSGALALSLPAVAPGTLIPTSGTLPVSNWAGGSAYHKPIDNIMSYRVTVNPLSVNNNAATTITLTYTLIAN
jgi:hypothetical protein